MGTAVSFVAPGALAALRPNRLVGHATKPVLTVGVSTYNTLNPALGNGNTFQYPLSFEPIVHATQAGTYSPGLATSWGYVGKNNLEFEFTLRHDARFSDGTLVTAQAVKAWFEYFSKASGPYVLDMGTLDKVDTVGKWTVQLHFKTPNPIVPWLLAETPSNWGLVSSPKELSDPSLLATHTYGAGPYTIDPSATVIGSVYTYVPNKYYYDPSAISYSKVVLKVISDPNSMLEAIKTGQIEVAQGTADTATAAHDAGLHLVSGLGGFEGLAFMDLGGTLAKPLASAEVREAMNYAVDRKAITQAIESVFGHPTSEVLSPDGFVPKYENYYSYDPAKAKQLLAKAGYPNGFTLDVLESPTSQTMMEAIASYLAAVGIKLNVSTAATPPQYSDELYGGSFPAALTSGGGVSPWWLFYPVWLKPHGLLDQHGWLDSTLQSLWQKGETAADPTSYWDQMSIRTVTHADFLPIFLFDSLWYVAKGIGGVTINPVFHLPNPADWHTTH